MERLPTAGEIREDLTAAEVVIVVAGRERRKLRRRHKRRDPERIKVIEKQIADLERHGSILRSHLKRSDWHRPPFTPYAPECRKLIKDRLALARRERQKLRKMLPP